MSVLRKASSKVIVRRPENTRRGRRAGLVPAAIAGDARRAMPDAAIRTIGTILEKRNPVLYRVELPNGKEILAHLSKPLTDAKAEFADGVRVLLEMTAFDFDQARILGAAV